MATNLDVTDDQRSSEVAGQANFDQVFNSRSSMLSDCATMGTAYGLYWKKERNILSFYTVMACQSFLDKQPVLKGNTQRVRPGMSLTLVLRYA